MGRPQRHEVGGSGSAWLALALVTGCGARTGLAIPPAADAGPEICDATGAEVCNGRDDDCDGTTDEGLGFGVIAGPFEVAREPTGYFTSDLVASGGGLVAVWNVGFDGSHPPVTNAFSRRLDPDGHAIGDPTPILGRPVTMGLTASEGRSGILLTYCGRFGADDRASSAFLDALGAPLGGEVRRGDGMRSCGAVSQSGIDTGARLLFAWLTNGGSSDGTYPVFLDVADDAGRAIDGRVAEPRGDLYTQPTFARRGDRVALAYGVRPTLRESAIDVVVLGREGAALGGPTRVGSAPVEERSFGGAHVVPSAEGFLVVAADTNGSGLYRARTDPSGALLAPLERVETSDRRFDQLDVVAAGGATVAVANAYRGPDSTLYVARLDADGRPDATWEGGADVPYALVPALAVEGTRVFLLSGAVDGRTLEIREFGCAP